MAFRKDIATGSTSFAAIISGNYYYVDKTQYIKELIESGESSVLFVRPRRFGKSLTLDALRCFLELNYRHPEVLSRPQALFRGLNIFKDQEFCHRHLGQYPVIFVSLKEVCGGSFADALNSLKSIIAKLYADFEFVTRDKRLEGKLRQRFLNILNLDETENPARIKELIIISLAVLCRVLYRIYKKAVFVLIDEYGVPLQQARTDEDYENIKYVISQMLGSVTCTNSVAVRKCILAGGTGIPPESIFDTCNNVVVYGISEEKYAGFMGFDAAETADMLSYYSLSDCAEQVKNWYGGYRFFRAKSIVPGPYCVSAPGPVIMGTGTPGIIG